jgi:mannose-1-phosphate guanylyltransferase
MLPVGHRPILEHIVEWLKGSGITDIVISTGYLGRAIEDYFGDGSDFGVKVEYARARNPLGIAGQLRNAESKLGERFVCLYGDAILDFDLRKLLEFHAQKRAMLTMALMREKIQSKYGVIELKEDGAIRRWNEKPVIENDINIGCYVMQKTYLGYIPAGLTYGMKEAFEAALKNRELLFGLKVEGTFRDIGDRAAYREADDYYSNLYGKAP